MPQICVVIDLIALQATCFTTGHLGPRLDKQGPGITPDPLV